MSAVLPPAVTPTPASHPRRAAWLWLLSTPVFFVAAFVVGEGLAAWLGLEEGAVSTFSWRELLVLVVALAVLSVPAVGATVVARHAAGDRWAWLPAGLLWAVVLVFLVSNVVGWFVAPAPG